MATLISHGGAGTVTGSLHLLDLSDGRILLDAGAFQGNAAVTAQNEQRLQFDVSELSAVLISHAHLDHSGRLPLLVRAGYRGPIFVTPATADLVQVLLTDAAHVAESEGKSGPTDRDIRRVVDLLEPVDYHQRFEICPGVTAMFFDAGHILGSAITCLTYSDRGRRVRLVYSGDLGKQDTPIIKDPDTIPGADIVIMESTYGDRTHEPSEDNRRRLVELLRHVSERGGNLIIPAFAVGRSQELLWWFDQLYVEGRAPRLPVVLDSPMAQRATDVFLRHRECFDRAAREEIAAGRRPMVFEQLEYAETTEDSKQLNDRQGIVIIAGSGMADGGRVQHHLKRHLPRSESAVLFAGYQAKGTLGRRILSARHKVEIGRRRVPVKARIEQLDGLSAHADRHGLADWLAAMTDPLPRLVILVHGENRARKALAEQIPDCRVIMPQRGRTINLRTGTGTRWRQSR